MRAMAKQGVKNQTIETLIKAFNEQTVAHKKDIGAKEKRALKDFQLIEAVVVRMISTMDLFKEQTGQDKALLYHVSFITDFDMKTGPSVVAVIDVNYDRDRTGRFSKIQRFEIEKRDKAYYLKIIGYDRYDKVTPWTLIQKKKRVNKSEFDEITLSLLTDIAHLLLDDDKQRLESEAKERIYQTKRRLNLKFS